MAFYEIKLFIRDLREKNNESVEHMAKKIGITSYELQEVIDGKRKLTEKEVENIIQKYNIQGKKLETLKRLTNTIKLFQITCEKCKSNQISIGKFYVNEEYISLSCCDCETEGVLEVGKQNNNKSFNITCIDCKQTAKIEKSPKGKQFIEIACPNCNKTESVNIDFLVSDFELKKYLEKEKPTLMKLIKSILPKK
ncbi:helix-turn-helix transcriptional regulator [Clostridioides difficile]|uniref:helix-turn-helix transcriptional regulator n=1 Tax=Clostridioides difficile TaxID=1496 RepID=UPI001034AE19|nr:helix-turn-helix transcriptional regulator [Clostridioides difficile]MDM9944115.1 helix-turn-helix transcriptional regulator [Clostridioides difficile]